MPCLAQYYCVLREVLRDFHSRTLSWNDHVHSRLDLIILRSTASLLELWSRLVSTITFQSRKYIKKKGCKPEMEKDKESVSHSEINPARASLRAYSVEQKTRMSYLAFKLA